jgi:hypothetical protein
MAMRIFFQRLGGISGCQQQRAKKVKDDQTAKP